MSDTPVNASLNYTEPAPEVRIDQGEAQNDSIGQGAFPSSQPYQPGQGAYQNQQGGQWNPLQGGFPGIGQGAFPGGPQCNPGVGQGAFPSMPNCFPPGVPMMPCPGFPGGPSAPGMPPMCGGGFIPVQQPPMCGGGLTGSPQAPGNMPQGQGQGFYNPYCQNQGQPQQQQQQGFPRQF